MAEAVTHGEMTSPHNETEQPDPTLHDEIALRAYSIFQARGGGHGADLDDWFEAEREVLQRRRSQIH